MIDWLKIGKSATFFRKKGRLPKAAIDDLFRVLRQEHPSPSNNLFKHVKDQHGRAHWSAIAFYYDRDPSFLELPLGQPRERVCGFVLLVEYKEFVALFKAGLDIPSSFKSEHFERVGSDRVEKAIAQTDATFEKIRLRNMASSKYTLRAKTLEAVDLQTVVGPASTRRFVPQGYRVRRGTDHFSATPSTGRISERSERAAYTELITWVTTVADRIAAPGGQTSAFIGNFAREVDLGTIAAPITPTFFGVDVSFLTDELFESNEPKRLIRWNGDVAQVVNKQDTDAILAALDQSFAIRISRGQTRIIDPRNQRQIGELKTGKSRISLKALELPEALNISIEAAAGQPGTDPNGMPLKRFIDRSDIFSVLFSDFTLAYIDGALYRDNQIEDGGASFLRYFIAEPSLALATSEKGAFIAGQPNFDVNSVFSKVVQTIALNDNALVCDDLGDEWADFIGICTTTNPRSISFYHAKHGGLSLSASAFHAAVGQALKNLGRMPLLNDALVAKSAFWSGTYNAPGVQTAIPRMQRGSFAQFQQAAIDARSAPDSIRRVFIVTSSLSKQQLENAFAQVGSGAAPLPHFIQLYWLLMTFISACAEVGACAYIVCQP